MNDPTRGAWGRHEDVAAGFEGEADGSDEEPTGGHEGLGARHRIDTDDPRRPIVSDEDVACINRHSGTLVLIR